MNRVVYYNTQFYINLNLGETRSYNVWKLKCCVDIFNTRAKSIIPHNI